MMSYDAFKEIIKEMILDYLPADFSDSIVEIHSITKNNDTHLDGLVVRQKEVNAGPTIYLNWYYLDYAGGRDMEDILRELAEMEVNYKLESDIPVADIFDFEKVKERIICRLVGKNGNQQYLKGKPNTQIEDLTITYHLYGEQDDAQMSVVITEEILAHYGISKEELHQLALENTRRIFSVQFTSMIEKISEMMGLSPEEMELPLDEIGMYVLSNTKYNYGAVNILYPDVMEHIREKIGDDFYILPSSIHEVILLKGGEDVDYHRLEEMVREVNKTLMPEEILSDNVYRFDFLKQRIVRCTEVAPERKISEIERKKNEKPNINGPHI